MKPAKHSFGSVHVRLVACLVAGTLLAGCWGGRRDGKVLVTGTVKHAGKALSHGSVLFSPAAGDGGTALIASAGQFSVALLPGEYRIVVRCDDGSGTISEGGVYAPGKSLIPERYGDAATSDLKVTVNPGMQPLHLDLPP